MDDGSKKPPPNTVSLGRAVYGMWYYVMAPLIEAAGNVDAAVRVGLLSARDSADAKELLPKCRGGLYEEWPEKDWKSMVESIVKQRKLNMDVLRRLLADQQQ